MTTILPGNSSQGRSATDESLPINNSIYRVAAFDDHPGLVHGISTRLSPSREDWNLSAKRGTPQHPPGWERAIANRGILAERLGIKPTCMVGCQQVHGAEVAVVGRADAGRGMHPDTPAVAGADALVTSTAGLYLLALAADCPPIFFYDPVRRIVALAHSGWKGTAARIAANVVEAMVDNFGSDPADIVAAVGPGIGPCCYAVGQNVIEAVESSFMGAWSQQEALLEARDGQTYFNLRSAIKRTLIEAGLGQQNVSVEDICTAHHLEAFYSHRAETGQCGLFGAVLGLREA